MSETKNYEAIRYGTKDGELKFGHIHKDNTLSAAMIRSGSESLHYITLDSTGDKHRKNGTIYFEGIMCDGVPKKGEFFDIHGVSLGYQNHFCLSAGL